jgi:hypothetical protein
LGKKGNKKTLTADCRKLFWRCVVATHQGLPHAVMKRTRRRFGARRDNHAMKTIRLKEGKERSLLRRHPWIFDGAIARGAADAGN